MISSRIAPDKTIIKPTMMTFKVPSKNLYISILPCAAWNVTLVFITLTDAVSFPGMIKDPIKTYWRTLALRVFTVKNFFAAHALKF